MKTDRSKVSVLQEVEQKNTMNRVREILLAIFLLAGILLSCRPVSDSIFCLLAAFVVGVVVIVVRNITEKNRLYIVGVVAFALTSPLSTQGFLDLLNKFITLWNLRFGTDMICFATRSSAQTGAVCLWGVIAIPLAAFLVTQIGQRHFSGPVFLILVAMFINFVLGRTQSMWSVMFLIIGVIWMNVTYTTAGRRFGIRGYLTLAGILALGLSLLAMSEGYKSLGSMERFKQQVAECLEEIRYGKDTLPRGDFREESGLLSGSEVTLKVKMDTPQELYLRGFVGGEYLGDHWATLPVQDYQGDNEGILRWLKNEQFEPVKQYAAYEKITADVVGIDPEYTQVEVENVGACRKYLYLPVSATGWTKTEGKTVKDWQIQSRRLLGTSSYYFRITGQDPTLDTEIAAGWLDNVAKEEQKQYRDAEAVYHSFVAENYTEVPEDMKDLVKETFFPENEDEDMNLGDLTGRIRKILRDETVYAENPQNVPKNKNLVKWFLTEYKEGNAVSYATAAVLAYRTAGYPARYVEGYHLTVEEAQMMTENEETSIDLTTKNAHAWVEVYMPGVGWLPEEVTPGMYVENYTDQIVSGKPSYKVNSTQKDQGPETKSDGNESKQQRKNGQKKEQKTLGGQLERAGAVLLVICYILLILYLILELQRYLRLSHQNKNEKEMDSEAFVEEHLTSIERMLAGNNIFGDYAHPKELWERVAEEFPGITRREYMRTVELIQKVRFGGKELLPYERHTLHCFYDHMVTIWYTESRVFRKMVLRYYYLVEIRK